MLTLSYANIRNPAFMSAFGKLVTAPMKDAKLSYIIAKIMSILQAEGKLMDAAWGKIVSEYCLKDESGEPVKIEGKEGQVRLDPAKIEEFTKQATEFEAITFETNGRKIKMEELEGISGLSGADILALEGIIIEA